MKNLILVLFTLLLTSAFAQMPNTADSVYWTPKYCNTAETAEDALDQWIWSGNPWILDCIQPSQLFVDAFTDENGNVSLWLSDTYECCCQVASLPGSEAAWTGFFGSNCQTYLDSVGFIYDDPNFVNWTSIDEDMLELNDIYIDPFGRQYTIPPKGLSVMNKKKYYRL
jgi:hypothetical protein